METSGVGIEVLVHQGLIPSLRLPVNSFMTLAVLREIVEIITDGTRTSQPVDHAHQDPGLSLT